MEFLAQLGNFGIANNNSIYEIYALPENDEILIKDYKLKGTEIICRCNTQRSLIAGITYLVKINVEKKLVYFLEDLNNNVIKFNGRGLKLIYFNYNKINMFISK